MVYKFTDSFAPTTPMGQTLNKFTNQAFSNVPTPYEAQKMEAEIAAKQLEAEQLSNQLSAQGQLGDVFRNAMLMNYQGPQRDGTAGFSAPATPQHIQEQLPNVMSTVALAGSGNASQLGDSMGKVIQAMSAYGGTDEMARRGLVAAGNSPSEKFALTPGRADAIAGRDEAMRRTTELAKIAATPLTETQAKADILEGFASTLTDLQKGSMFGTNLKDTEVTAVIGPDGKPVMRTNTDAIAPGYTAVPPQAQSMSDLNITKPTQTRAESALITANSMRGTISQARANAKPENFGFTGDTRQFVQDARGQADAFTTWLDGDVKKTYQESLAMVATGGIDETDPIDPNKLFNPTFDPSLSKLDLLSNSLTMQYAKMLDDNGKISNEDFRNAQRALGLDRAFANIDDFNARMDSIEETLTFQEQQSRSLMNGDIMNLPLPPQQQQQSTVIRITGDADYDRLPSGTRFIDPNGNERTKP